MIKNKHRESSKGSKWASLKKYWFLGGSRIFLRVLKFTDPKSWDSQLHTDTKILPFSSVVHWVYCPKVLNDLTEGVIFNTPIFLSVLDQNSSISIVILTYLELEFWNGSWTKITRGTRSLFLRFSFLCNFDLRELSEISKRAKNMDVYSTPRLV